MAIQLPEPAIRGLQEVLEEFKPVPGLVLFGDGSADRGDQPIGWACLHFEVSTNTAYVLTGMVAYGTNNMAELLPYVHGLAFHERLCHSQERIPPRNVLIISDSQVTVDCGNGTANPAANHSLWAGIQSFKRDRYSIRWRHVPRNSNPFSRWMDDIADYARAGAAELEKILLRATKSTLPWQAAE